MSGRTKGIYENARGGRGEGGTDLLAELAAADGDRRAAPVVEEIKVP
jgi:hypothetical protein